MQGKLFKKTLSLHIYGGTQIYVVIIWEEKKQEDLITFLKGQDVSKGSSECPQTLN